MPLSVGDKIGHYEVISLLGQGGMGEVYRARDTRLKRDVALKVLPVTFLRDPARMARFQREAEVLASLDHPNIGHIHGIADSADSRGLILALIEGPTLADRIEAGPLPQDEAVAIAKQIIEALEYAHDRGVVHRDLKPANIKITSEGVVKVLDFGLAKVKTSLRHPRWRTPPTLTLGHTRTGVILGTAAYMSPEQAVGRPVDRRSDIFSFGAVLYEMLTGKRAFTGATTPDVLEAVVKNEPDWSALPATTPGYLRRLLARALAKDRKQRLQAIGEARIALENRWADEPPAVRVSVPSQSRLGKLTAIGAGVMTVVAAVALWAPWRKPPAPPEMVQFQIQAPERAGNTALLVLSPDGRHMLLGGVAPDGRERLWLRSLGSLDARVLPGTDNPGNPFWSVDSRFFVFGADGKLKKVPIAGGPPQVICDLPDNNSRGGSWNQDGVIVIGSQTGGITRVPAAGGTRSEVTVVDRSRQESSHGRPVFLPDGKHFLYLRISADDEISGIYVGSLDVDPQQQSRQRLLPGHLGIGCAPSPDPAFGYVLYLQDETPMAQPFDNQRLQLTGEPVLIADQVGNNGNTTNYFSVSQNGALIYRRVAVNKSRLQWFDRKGKVLSAVGEPGGYLEFALSPDATRIAVGRRDSSNPEVSVVDSARGTSTRLTFNPGQQGFPLWSADGNEIFYVSYATGPPELYRKSANGADLEKLVLQTNSAKYPTDVSSDGKYLLYTENQTNGHIFVLPLDGDRKPTPFFTTRMAAGHAKFSPDGRWVVYSSAETGRLEIYVRPFPATVGGGGKWMISNGGGGQPRWRRDGKEIVYLALNGELTAVEVSTNSSFQAGTPRALFPIPLMGGVGPGSNGWNWDFTADGQRFLINTAAEAVDANGFTINVVLNWNDLLKR